MKKRLHPLLGLALALCLLLSCQVAVLAAETAPMPENLALGATATASQVDPNERYGTPDRVTDGNALTSWHSGFVWDQDQWVQLDFGEKRRFNTVQLLWDSKFPTGYTVQVSDDGINWTPVGSVTEGTYEEIRGFNFPEQNCRFLRVHITEKSTDDRSVVLLEVMVYNVNWEFVKEKAVRQVNDVPVPAVLTDSFQVPRYTDWGAEINWTSDDCVRFDGGNAAYTPPLQTKTITLQAQVSWGDHSFTRSWQSTAAAKKDQSRTYSVYPVPQEMQMHYGTAADLSQPLIYLESGVSAVTRVRLEEVLTASGISYRFTDSYENSNLALGIHGSGSPVDIGNSGSAGDLFAPDPKKFDTYYLSVSSPRTVLLGQQDSGVFCGLATLQQILEQQSPARLPGAEFLDFADRQYRGIIQAEAGDNYTPAEIRSLLDFMERYKMNTYFYMPEHDDYNDLQWEEPYPESLSPYEQEIGQLTGSQVGSLASYADENGVSFVWGCRPILSFDDTQSMEQGLQELMEKLSHMYDLGVRQAALFLGEKAAADAALYAENHVWFINELQSRLKEKYHSGSDPMKDLFFSPACKDILTSDIALRDAIYQKYQAIDPDVTFFLTGTSFWSNIDRTDTETLFRLMDREMVMWWNYPTNANIPYALRMQKMDAYKSVSSQIEHLGGLLSCPMNQPEASKVMVFSVGNFSWNTRAFDAEESWEQSFHSYSDDPAIADAIRTFATYCDFEVDFSPLRDIFRQYRKNPLSVWQEAQKEAQKIAASCNRILEFSGSDQPELVRLEAEIRPWVNLILDRARVLDMCLAYRHGQADLELNLKAAALNTHINAGDDPRYFTTFFHLMEFDQVLVQSGEIVLEPFQAYAADAINSPPLLPPPQVLSNLDTQGLSLTVGSENAVGSGRISLDTGDYVILDLGAVHRVTGISELSGLVSAGSLNGRDWNDDYTHARYIRYLNTGEQIVSADLGQCQVRFQTGATPVFTSSVELYAEDTHPASFAVDGDPATYVWTKGTPETGASFQTDFGRVCEIPAIQMIFPASGDTLDGKAEVSYKDANGSWQVIREISSTELQNGTLLLQDLNLTGSAIRFTITEQRSGYWLQICEFNIPSTDMAQVPVQTVVNGQPRKELTDGVWAQEIYEETAGSLTFEIFQAIVPKQVQILNDDVRKKWDGISVYGVDGSGKEHLLERLPRPQQDLILYDTSGLPDLRSLKITWTQKAVIGGIVITGPVYLAPNLTMLQKALEEAAVLDTTGMTPEQEAAFHQAVNTAKAHMQTAQEGGYITQAQIDADTAALADAMAAGAQVEGSVKADGVHLTLTDSLAGKIPNAGGRVLAAAYDVNGRLLTFAMEPVTKTDREILVAGRGFDGAQVKTVKVFLTDGSWVPMAPAFPVESASE